MIEPLIDSRIVKLITPGGISADVTVRALNALQLFEYQSGLVDVEWPEAPPEGDARAIHKHTLKVQKLIYELNVTMAAFGLQYLHPGKPIDEVKALVMESYLPDHALRLAMAVKALSGLATAPASEDSPAADADEQREPTDPKKA
ncbi:hypothetical protein [Aeromonas sp. sif2416]|uniref:hypothetical protein n=1 Tax=Aeromonas sp. sif2416 TaxID=2854793 RepID=UPI001C4464C6|nr:hypothetical protein [Aeromonas sp. sif2416]MBV7439062.1 hypothetical protein [Aeromonas sp. sif2416]